MSRKQRQGMIYREHRQLSLVRQYLKTPFYGSRKTRAWLQGQGHSVGRNKVRRLMWLMGLAAIYLRPNTSKPAPAHRIYPYLLNGVAINRVNQVWSADITYLPIAQGFLYLSASLRAGSGSHRGLAQPVHTGLAIVQHYGCGFLRRGSD